MRRTDDGELPSRRKPAGRRTLVLILGSLAMIGPLSTDMYLPALPTIAEDLNTSPSGVHLSLSVYLLGLALGQLLAGPLSDSMGRRKPLIAGVAAYAARHRCWRRSAIPSPRSCCSSAMECRRNRTAPCSP